MTGNELTCSAPASFPLDVMSGAGFVIDGSPVVCGGQDTDTTHLLEGQCFQYDAQTDTWNEVIYSKKRTEREVA